MTIGLEHLVSVGVVYIVSKLFGFLEILTFYTYQQRNIIHNLQRN